jgi:hypothetical protein
MNPFVTIDDTRKGFIRNGVIFSVLTQALFSCFLNLKTKQNLKIAQNLSTVSYKDASFKDVNCGCI